MNRIILTAFAVTLALVIACGDSWAQATAQIAGTVKDQTSAVLPGVEVTVTQTDTGIMRTTVTNETGSYVLSNLPIGPYKLEATLPGFRTYAQTGIVLQVNASPVINPVLEVGQVTEQVQVEANAALVETRSSGIGQVVENARILDLPLNGRAMIDLVALSGASTPAPILDGTGGRDPFTKGNVSVAGGLNTGLNTTLDGAYHNNPYDGGYMSMPFPDALQEFKVETGATAAQNGVKSSGTVSLVTKSGTNEFHGDLFEFVRNGAFNARNAFATKRDTIKRNQFGGTIGGPIMKNKLFFFGAYQGTTIRQAPTDTIGFVPTPAMLAGDWTAFTSPACNGGRQIALRAPFVNNRIDPTLYNGPAVKFASKLPATSDPCGRINYATPNLENDHMTVGRIDYQWSANHSIFGRYLLDSLRNPAPFDLGGNPLTAGETAKKGLAQAFTLGDTYLIGANIVNAFRFTANRIAGGKTNADYNSAGLGPADIGIKSFALEPHRPLYTVTGAFNSATGALANTGSNSTGSTNNAIFGANDDVSVLRGNHQLALGTQWTYTQINSYSNSPVGLSYTFNGQTTGLGLADFFTGNASQFQAGTYSEQFKRQNYLGIYGNDTWKLNQKWTLSYGLRWEPYFPMRNLDGGAIGFDENALKQGIKTNRFTTAPPGVFFEGDPGFPGSAGLNRKLWNFSPRVGLAWDVNGDGRTSVRVSAGTFYDFPSAMFLQGLTTGAPFTVRITRTNVNFADPWAGYPGGDPFPIAAGRNLSRNAPWLLSSPINDIDPDSPNMQVAQWNLSLQKQVGTGWLLSANYIGNTSSHMWGLQQTNPSLYLGLGPCTLNGVAYSVCSTTANREARRRLTLENPTIGPNYGFISRIDTGGKASYNGLVLSAQRRVAHGLTFTSNYTWSHCISDPWVQSTNSGLGGTGWTSPNDRLFDRGNCTVAATDRRHVFNLTAAADTPRFTNTTLRTIASGWHFSPIVRILSGGFFSVTTSQDAALSAITGQRVNQVLGSPYGDKTPGRFLNPAAFAMPAPGTIGNMGSASIEGPSTWQFDAALSRTFQVRENKKMEFRAEAFNVTNSFHMDDRFFTTNFNSNTFGQVTAAKDPRIMQFALKYVF